MSLQAKDALWIINKANILNLNSYKIYLILNFIFNFEVSILQSDFVIHKNMTFCWALGNQCKNCLPWLLVKASWRKSKIFQIQRTLVKVYNRHLHDKMNCLVQEKVRPFTCSPWSWHRGQLWGSWPWSNDRYWLWFLWSSGCPGRS